MHVVEVGAVEALQFLIKLRRPSTYAKEEETSTVPAAFWDFIYCIFLSQEEMTALDLAHEHDQTECAELLIAVIEPRFQ